MFYNRGMSASNYIITAKPSDSFAYILNIFARNRYN